MTTTLEIKPHPQGGLTVAVPVPGTATARVYMGRYEGARQAHQGLTYMEEVYARRRTWTKTDTERLLDERVKVGGPRATTQFGKWLRANNGKKFERIHARVLAAGTDEARAAMDVAQLV